MNSQQKKTLEQRVGDLEGRVEAMERGFPDGDVEGHSRYHRMVMEEYMERRRIKQAVIEQIVKGSVWATLIFLAGAAWTYSKEHIIPMFVKGSP